MHILIAFPVHIKSHTTHKQPNQSSAPEGELSEELLQGQMQSPRSTQGMDQLKRHLCMWGESLAQSFPGQRVLHRVMKSTLWTLRLKKFRKWTDPFGNWHYLALIVTGLLEAMQDPSGFCWCSLRIAAPCWSPAILHATCPPSPGLWPWPCCSLRGRSQTQTSCREWGETQGSPPVLWRTTVRSSEPGVWGTEGKSKEPGPVFPPSSLVPGKLGRTKWAFKAPVKDVKK